MVFELGEWCILDKSQYFFTDVFYLNIQKKGGINIKIKTNKNNANLSFKVTLYLISLIPLFIMVFILNVKFALPDSTNLGVIFLHCAVPCAALIAIILALVLVYMVNYRWSGVTNPPYKIIEIKSENYEYMTFLTTCIIPLIGFDLAKPRHVIVLLFLLVAIGYLFVKLDLYYMNPTLAFMGYRLYRVKIRGVDAPDGVVLISKSALSKDDYIRWIRIDKYVWVAKEVNNE